MDFHNPPANPEPDDDEDDKPSTPEPAKEEKKEDVPQQPAVDASDKPLTLKDKLEAAQEEKTQIKEALKVRNVLTWSFVLVLSILMQIRRPLYNYDTHTTLR